MAGLDGKWTEIQSLYRKSNNQTRPFILAAQSPKHGKGGYKAHHNKFMIAPMAIKV